MLLVRTGQSTRVEKSRKRAKAVSFITQGVITGKLRSLGQRGASRFPGVERDTAVACVSHLRRLPEH